ncbi:DUF2251 domain-containing protein [Metabacillus sp. KIGAM252]|uniref:DUF2251 domain-containing protein n=1 Tax=Metabacillus flavus TaxID=2823519 RepID=A0ABS5L9Z7_9BACI|nr:DUF2251 domain-containing protein [Metabacillus flavus]MBS2967547.1 DUF2251 domain-containing protein [Metabacillus flavus]
MSTMEEPFFTAAVSPNSKWQCVFEDDGETGYLYLCHLLPNGDMEGIADALWVYNQIVPPITDCQEVFITWAEDSSRAALIVDDECWGMFDLQTKRKLEAERKNNIIVPISFETWEHGVKKDMGEELETTVQHEKQIF